MSKITEKIKEIHSGIKGFPDYPKKGIIFQDIFSSIAKGRNCLLLKEVLIDIIKAKFPDVDYIVGLESRGFLFAFCIAAELGLGCIPVRKKGKLPGPTVSYDYILEYGTDTFEMQKDTIKPQSKCLIVDDLIATGGSMEASVKLLEMLNATCVGALVVIEATDLGCRSKFKDNFNLVSLIQMGRDGVSFY